MSEKFNVIEQEFDIISPVELRFLRIQSNTKQV